MKYEYSYITLELSEERKQMIQMGLANIDELNSMIRDIINDQAEEGWEPLYPFSVPSIWLRRPKTVTRKRKTRKTT